MWGDAVEHRIESSATQAYPPVSLERAELESRCIATGHVQLGPAELISQVDRIQQFRDPGPACRIDQCDSVHAGAQLETGLRCWHTSSIDRHNIELAAVWPNVISGQTDQQLID